MNTNTYLVEGYKGHDVVGFRTVVRPLTAIREAWHLTNDLGATIVWVRRNGQAVYTFDGMFWMKHRGDEAFATALENVEN